MIAVFHGHYSHPPNREAAELIDQQIAPAIVEQNIDVTFLLVGKDPPKTSSPNVHTTGFVDDLFSVLNAADVAIVPILYGGGTKTKLYDYVSLSIPMVATKKATEGVDLVHDEHVLSTKDINKEFVANLADVLQRQAIRTRIQENLLNLADMWSWETSVEYLMNAYDNFN
jgi:glycosyltransferase involved in cell wall biosynthesis